MPTVTHPAAPKVFISSTVREFQDLRSALDYTLRSQGIRVKLSEAADFDVVGDRPAIEECFANVRDSDYYVLLIGNNRGSFFDENERISVTRQEYRVARDQFLATGKPIMLMFLRRATEDSLRGDRQGIDDPEHLTAFIQEVQTPPIQGSPSYLKRFRDFADVMDAIAIRLNLGRSFSETLTRHALVSELTWNLAQMVKRHVNTVFEHHAWSDNLRRVIGITIDNQHLPITVSGGMLNQLFVASLEAIRTRRLRTRAIEDAISSGTFLDFDPINNAFRESALHQRLHELLIDIQSFRDVEEAAKESGKKIQLTIINKSTNHGRVCQIGRSDLVFLFAFFNRLENVFNGHKVLCRYLLGVNEELEEIDRRPITPLGKEVESGMRREQVSAAEIQHLIRNDVFPFGNRIMPNTLGESPEERIQLMSDLLRDHLEQNYPDLQISEERLREMAESSLDSIGSMFAPPEAGIQDFRA